MPTLFQQLVQYNSSLSKIWPSFSGQGHLECWLCAIYECGSYILNWCHRNLTPYLLKIFSLFIIHGFLVFPLRSSELLLFFPSYPKINYIASKFPTDSQQLSLLHCLKHILWFGHMPYKNTTGSALGINEPLHSKHKFQTWKISWGCNSSSLQEEV